MGRFVLVEQLAAAVRNRWRIGVRAGVAVGLPLFAGVIAGRTSWGAIASMGAFAGFYVSGAPLRHRLRTMVCVGLAITLVVPVSSLVSDTAWLAILWIGVVACVASFVCLALAVPPPREYLIVLASLAGTGIPQGGGGALREAWLIAAGAALAVAVNLVAELARSGPEPSELAVAQAWNAVAGVLEAAGTERAAAVRRGSIATVRQARIALAQDGGPLSVALWPRQAAAEVLLAAALSVSIDATVPVPPEVIADVRALGGDRPGLNALPAPAVLADAVTTAQAVLSGDEEAAEVRPLTPPALWQRLLEAASPHGVVLPSALRIAVTVAVGAAVGRALGLDHSYWVGLTCAAALQANNVTLLLVRTAHRVVGTVLGVALAGGLFALTRAGAVIALAGVLAQAAAETVIAASYAVGVTFITVIALAIFELAAGGGHPGTVIAARLLDTAIGAVLVVLLRALLWPRANAARLPRAQAGTLRATAELFSQRWLAPETNLTPAQHRLQEQLLGLRTLTEDARGDRMLGAAPDREDPVTAAIDSLATLALAVNYGRPEPDRGSAVRYIDHWRGLAAAIDVSGAGAGAAADAAAAPDLAGYPRTVAATRILSLALAARRSPN